MIDNAVESQNDGPSPEEIHLRIFSAHQVEKRLSKRNRTFLDETKQKLNLNDLSYPPIKHIPQESLKNLICSLEEFRGEEEVSRLFQRILTNAANLSEVLQPKREPILRITTIDGREQYAFIRTTPNALRELVDLNFSVEKAIILSFRDTHKTVNDLLSSAKNSQGNVTTIKTLVFNEKLSLIHGILRDGERGNKLIAIVKSNLYPLFGDDASSDDMVVLRWIVRSIVPNELFLVLFKDEQELKKISPFIFYDCYMQNFARNMAANKPGAKLETLLSYLCAETSDLLTDQIQLSQTITLILREIEILQAETDTE